MELIFAALIPVGIWEVTSGMHLHISKLEEEIRQRFLFAPTTVFYNQNDYATYLAISLSMILVWMRYCGMYLSTSLLVLSLLPGYGY